MTDKMQTEQDSTNHAYYSVYTPTRWQRFCRWAGFRYHYGEEPEGAENQQFVPYGHGPSF